MNAIPRNQQRQMSDTGGHNAERKSQVAHFRNTHQAMLHSIYGYVCVKTYLKSNAKIHTTFIIKGTWR